MTKQRLSRLAEVVLVSLFFLMAVYLTLAATVGQPSLWVLAR